MMRSLVLLVALGVCYTSVMATMQSIKVKGVAICNKRRLSNVQVQLYEQDVLDPNDLLAETRTNSEGEFEVSGQEDEVGTIQPFIRITHNCMVSKPGCLRVADYTVPQDKVGGVYDMTFVTLDIKVDNESENC